MARKIIGTKSKKWQCESQGNGRLISCEEKGGHLLSMFDDGDVRFNKVGKDCTIRADGVKLRNRDGEGLCGVELT